MSSPRVAPLLRLSVVLGGLSKHYLDPPGGNRTFAPLHHTVIIGAESLGEFFPRQAASSLSRSPKSFGKSSG